MSGRRALDQYLLYACSPRAEDAAGVPAAAWDGLPARAGREKLSNLVLARWKERVGQLPPKAHAELRRGGVQNFASAARLLELLGLLEAHRIPALPFKGPLLAETVFGGIERRNFGDLDILVPRESLETACRLLMDQGYRTPHEVPFAEYLRTTLRGGHHVGLWHPRHCVYVELHWELSGRFLPVALDFAAVSPFLERVAFMDSEVWNFAAEAGLLYLCIHGAKEYWRMLDHVVCVAWHLEHRPPDWDALHGLAQRWGAEKILLTGLGLAAALFDVGPRERIERSLAGAPSVRRLVERQSERIFEDDRLSELRLGTMGEYVTMHWTHLGDPLHFFRWMVLRLTTPPIEDLEPAARLQESTRWKTTLAPFRAIRRFVERDRKKIGF